ncbi:cell division septal protein FtsQ [Virgibacillus natechei]|uniref:Cell division septal protein FtsQ n=1 Tax=Virgibacillus natechei TaxID=1216297 RepID=A0ABS4IE73_9BACI|nr:DUF4064 domain-containing protein [Virgibacillus natechei]MBP1968631.1 cell division septal protein FtsQ [Virgibacillus natechei]UZD13736.1 DUF4064 domain-containing protein [Virgibacillus natechei]
MKRTGEIVLGIIGALVYGFFGIIGGFMLWMQNNEELLQQSLEEVPQEGGAELSADEFSAFIEQMGSSGMMMLIVSIVAIILGIIALIFLKGNKKPKAAGIIFIATAVIAVFLVGIVGIFSGLFYLIAGIMCLARKPKAPIEA